jgi:hypothetical protein
LVTHDQAALAAAVSEMRTALAAAQMQLGGEGRWPEVLARRLVEIDERWPPVAELVREFAAREVCS